MIDNWMDAQLIVEIWEKRPWYTIVCKYNKEGCHKYTFNNRIFYFISYFQTLHGSIAKTSGNNWIFFVEFICIFNVKMCQYSLDSGLRIAILIWVIFGIIADGRYFFVRIRKLKMRKYETDAMRKLIYDKIKWDKRKIR